MNGSSSIIVTLERIDVDSGSIRTHWDDRILPRPGDEIDLYWSNEVPSGWENGAYVVRKIRAGILDADPRMPKSQPARLSVQVELVPRED